MRTYRVIICKDDIESTELFENYMKAKEFAIYFALLNYKVVIDSY